MNVSWLLMHGRSVRNLIAGRKTQTRRIVKPQPPLNEFGEPDIGPICGPEWFTPTCVDKDGEEYPGGDVFGVYDEDGEWGAKCPYGAPGDLLYVRETWCHFPRSAPDGMGENIYYRASQADLDSAEAVMRQCGVKWRPSIHMPRWASRITLRLTDVRVERVQEIRVDDCIAEGVEPNGNMHGYLGAGYKPAFAELWNDTNGAGAWDRNDWVWALTFAVIHANVDDVLADPEKYGIREAV